MKMHCPRGQCYQTDSNIFDSYDGLGEQGTLSTSVLINRVTTDRQPETF